MEKSLKNFFYTHELKLVYICLLIFCPLLLYGQKDKKGIQKGIVTDSVICAGFTLQSYSLYLPPEYDETMKWPLVLIFDPGGRGSTGIKNFIQAGNKYGYILACSNNVRNGNFQQGLSYAETMFDDVLSRFKVDERMIFIAGFSGGSRMATAFSANNKKIAGIIGCGAGLPNIRNFEPSMMAHLIYFGIVGNKDMNYQEMDALGQYFDYSGIPSFFLLFKGGHEWPSPTNLEIGLGWLKLKMMNRGVIKKNEEFINELFRETVSLAKESEKKSDMVVADRYYKYLIRDFPDFPETSEIKVVLGKIEQSEAYKKGMKDNERINEEESLKRVEYMNVLSGIINSKEMSDSIFNWWKYEIHSLRTSARSYRDSLMSSRLMNFVTIASVDNGSGFISNGNYKVASLLFTIYTICEPESKYSWYILARAEALNGQTDRADVALERSIKYGLSNKATVINDPAFAKMLNNRRFKKLTEKLK